MSTNPQPTTEPQPTTASTTEPTTEIEARGRSDPWTAPGDTASTPAARSQRQFEPTCRRRLRNLADKENAYCG